MSRGPGWWGGRGRGGSFPLLDGGGKGEPPGRRETSKERDGLGRGGGRVQFIATRGQRKSRGRESEREGRRRGCRGRGKRAERGREGRGRGGRGKRRGEGGVAWLRGGSEGGGGGRRKPRGKGGQEGRDTKDGLGPRNGMEKCGRRGGGGRGGRGGAQEGGGGKVGWWKGGSLGGRWMITPARRVGAGVGHT